MTTDDTNPRKNFGPVNVTHERFKAFFSFFANGEFKIVHFYYSFGMLYVL